MSLTSFIKQPEVREGFRNAITKPVFKCVMPIQASPMTKHYGLVGSAFDYLLRFFVERNNSNTNRYTWVAHLALTLLPEHTSLYRLAALRLKQAEHHYASYLETGVISDDLLSCALHLATIDVIFRAGPGVIRSEHLKQVDPLDIEDLRNLVSIVPKECFLAKRACVLNPSFGWASHLVGGADADIILDDTLVEIKTTKYLTLDRAYIDQLIGYYILLKLSGISSCLPKDFKCKEYELNYIGVYFARHGYLYKIPIHQVIDPDYLTEFAKWFVDSACPSRRERAIYYKRFTWSCCQQWLSELRSSERRQKAERAGDSTATRRKKLVPRLIKSGNLVTP
jgi:hypothetical protein